MLVNIEYLIVAYNAGCYAAASVGTNICLSYR